MELIIYGYYSSTTSPRNKEIVVRIRQFISILPTNYIRFNFIVITKQLYNNKFKNLQLNQI